MILFPKIQKDIIFERYTFEFCGNLEIRIPPTGFQALSRVSYDRKGDKITTF